MTPCATAARWARPAARCATSSASTSRRTDAGGPVLRWGPLAPHRRRGRRLRRALQLSGVVRPRARLGPASARAVPPRPVGDRQVPHQPRAAGAHPHRRLLGQRPRLLGPALGPGPARHRRRARRDGRPLFRTPRRGARPARRGGWGPRVRPRLRRGPEHQLRVDVPGPGGRLLHGHQARRLSAGPVPHTQGAPIPMSLSKTLVACGLTGLALAAAVPAQGAGTVVATGLNNPRGLALSPTGTLYVAESGRAGKTCLNKDTCVGLTGAIARVGADGKVARVASGLLSAGGPDGTFTTGVDDVAVAPDGGVFGILTSAPPGLAKGLPSKIRRQLGRVARASAGKAVFSGPPVDTIEFTSNPDKTDVNSDPYGLAIGLDGTQYVADAGGNTILSVKDDKVSLLGVVPKNGKAQAVPTVVRVGPDGALYVGVLGGDGTPKNGSNVYRMVPGEKPTIYAKGFNNVTGLAFDKGGSLYVTEWSRTLGKQGPNGDGDVVKI